jgi:hypothetical protein
MPEPELNKKWDKLLRAYARRPQPQVLLHPVSRRALQAEAAKTFGTSAKAPKKESIFAKWWVRGPLAVGFAAWAVLLVAQNRRYEESRMVAGREMPIAASPQAGRVALDSKSAAAPMAAQASAKLAASGASAAAGEFSYSTRQALKTQSSWRNTYATPVLEGRRKTADALVANAPTAASEVVLQTFQINRNGAEVRVQDRDGSVYSGQVTGAGATAEYGFAVQGTNRSTQQAVNFTGQVEAARVSGMATVGETNQVPVEAVPAAK